MIEVFEAPEKVVTNFPKLFLAGTIDNGESIDWQQQVIETLKNWEVCILNPRRSDWDSSWEQTKENLKFREQVEWELSGLEKADLILVNFIAGSQSPITLLELGLFSKEKNLHVVCPKGFWRRGNVEIICNRYDIPFYENIEDALSQIKLVVDLRVSL
jgi:hypothetical protein